jgi:cobaltochelatase CobT
MDNYLIYSTENDTMEDITDGDRAACKKFLDDSSACKKFLDDSRQITNALGRKFRLNLVSETRTRWDGGKRRGRLDKRRVHQLITGGSKNVFKRRTMRKGFDTTALLMIDHSDSMFPNSIDLAAKTALVFGENLHELAIPFSIWGYSTGHFHEGREVKHSATPQERDLYTRWGRLWVGVYKKFEENWPTNRHRCHQMSRNGKYNTYDGEAVRLAAQHLMLRPEKRKLLFVLCDGYPCPNCHEYMDTHAAYLKAVAREVEKQIEVFAIGIGHNDVKKFYSNAVGIHSLTDLPTVMLAEMDRLLRKGQNAYARG